MNSVLREHLSEVAKMLASADAKLRFPTTQEASKGREELSAAMARLGEIIGLIDRPDTKGEEEDVEGEQGDSVQVERPVSRRTGRGSSERQQKNEG